MSQEVNGFNFYKRDDRRLLSVKFILSVSGEHKKLSLPDGNRGGERWMDQVRALDYTQGGLLNPGLLLSRYQQ
jgi:hypothetical protein